MIDTWYQLAGIIIAIPVAGSIVWAVVKVVRHFSSVNEAITGRPASPTMEAVPSMIERFQSVDAHLKRQDVELADYRRTVDRELSTNGGMSIKDTVNRLDRKVDALTVAQEEGIKKTALDVTREIAAAIKEALPPT